MSKSLTINRLQSGGIITNYHCPSQCRHCLYACSPRWEKHYMESNVLVRLLSVVKHLGCTSVHIGGGEPFLKPAGLKTVLDTCRQAGVLAEYVETNSSWFKDEGQAISLLEDLKQAGLRTLLVSMSPFHNEYIPFWKVKGVIAACEQCGIGVFPWISAFYPEIDTFDDQKPHSLAEYQDHFGKNYLSRIPGRYWVHHGGRAIRTFADVFPSSPVDTILSRSQGGCRELPDTSHFHFDLHGHYVPGLCSGLAIQADDLGRPLTPDRYPLINTLFAKGIQGFLDLARQEHGFVPKDEYLSKCHLCTDIRIFLTMEKKLPSQELAPMGFYENLSAS